MSAFAFRQALDFIKSNRNPDGGWGYWPGRKSLVEPTCYCLLALSAGSDESLTSKGMGFLRSCQLTSGGMGISPEDKQGSWMSYAALLAFNAFDADKEKRRLIDWALRVEDASSRFRPEDIAAIRQLYRYDAAIRGWPWTPATTAWVESTALFVIALIRIGIPPEHERVRSGIGLLLDRRIRSGGWNFGNPFDKSHELEAGVLSTALALSALGAAGLPEGHPAMKSGAGFLGRNLEGTISTASLAWALIASMFFPSVSVLAPSVIKKLSGLQTADGGLRNNLFETALASIALAAPHVVAQTAGSAR